MLDHNFLIQIDTLYTKDIIKCLPKSRRLLCWLIWKKYILLSCVDTTTVSQFPSFHTERPRHLHPNPPPLTILFHVRADLLFLLIVDVQVYCSSQEKYSILLFSEHVLLGYRQKAKVVTSSLAGVYRQTATCISSRTSYKFSFQVTSSISAHDSAPRCLNRQITEFLNWRYQNSVIFRADTHVLHPSPLYQTIDPFNHTCKDQCCNFCFIIRRTFE